MWGKHYYFYDNVRLKFVGYQTIVDKIPSGTIIRLSLANWWDDGCGRRTMLSSVIWLVFVDTIIDLII